MRRVFLLLIVLLLPILPRGILVAAEKTDEDHLKLVGRQDEVDESIRKGLDWLVKQQDVTHGYFEGRLKNAYTGLACIALMASGHFPGRSEYGDNLRRGLLYLAKEAERNKGYLGKDGGRMYGHGICTLALTEAYGMMPDEGDNLLIKKALESCLKLILMAQVKVKNQHFGGWRYQPNSRDSDLSVTVWQVLALRSAQNCRLDIPNQAIVDSLKYVRSTYNKRIPGFCYHQTGGNSPSMRTAGVVCMMALGADETPQDKEMIENSAKFLPTFNPEQGRHFYYQSYYLATAANMLGGKYRDTMLPKLYKVLIGLQRKDGQFNKYRGYDGGVYSTSFAIICLAVRYQFLPIYQE